MTEKKRDAKRRSNEGGSMAEQDKRLYYALTAEKG